MLAHALEVAAVPSVRVVEVDRARVLEGVCEAVDEHEVDRVGLGRRRRDPGGVGAEHGGVGVWRGGGLSAAEGQREQRAGARASRRTDRTPSPHGTLPGSA